MVSLLLLERQRAVLQQLLCRTVEEYREFAALERQSVPQAESSVEHPLASRKDGRTTAVEKQAA